MTNRIRPSQQLLQAWDGLMQLEDGFTSNNLAELTGVRAGSVRNYLRAWVKNGLLERHQQYPLDTFSFIEGWHKTHYAQNLRSRYHYTTQSGEQSDSQAHPE